MACANTAMAAARESGERKSSVAADMPTSPERLSACEISRSPPRPKAGRLRPGVQHCQLLLLVAGRKQIQKSQHGRLAADAPDGLRGARAIRWAGIEPRRFLERRELR